MQPAASSTRLASQTKLLSQLSAVSEATLSGEGDLENLSAYFEPFGSALVPCAPGTRDSIASQESDSLLAAERKEASSCSETEEKEVGLPVKGSAKVCGHNLCTVSPAGLEVPPTRAQVW